MMLSDVCLSRTSGL